MIQNSSNSKLRSLIDSNSVEKIISFRSSIAQNHQICLRFEQIAHSFTSQLQVQKAEVQRLRLYLKDFEVSLKKALKQPSEVLEKHYPFSIKKQADFLLQAKKGQLNETLKTIAELSLLFKLLVSIRYQEGGSLNPQQQLISAQKRNLISYYREVIGYKQGKQLLLRIRNGEAIEEAIKKHPELCTNSLLKQQLDHFTNEQNSYESIYRILENIQSKLIGFKLRGSKRNNVLHLKESLQSVLQYINRSCVNNLSAKISPILVKNETDVSHILNLIHNGNIGLLSDKIEGVSDIAIKEAVRKIVGMMQKNSDIIQSIYSNIVKNLGQKSSLFPRNLRHLPFSRKLQQCKKISSMIDNRTLSHISCDSTALTKLHKIIDEQRNKRIQKQQQNAEKDQMLLQFQQQRYSLRIEIQNYQTLLMNANAQIRLLMQQKVELSSNCSLINQTLVKLKVQRIGNLQRLRQLQLQVITFQQEKEALQIEISTFKEHIFTLQQQHLSLKNQNRILSVKYQQLKEHSSLEFRQISLAVHQDISYKIEANPLSPIAKFEDDLIQDIFESPSQHPPRHSLQTSRKKASLRHARSYSIVDLCSQLLPQYDDKPEQQPSESVSSNDQIRRGIQVRERTIKKYQAFMEKQRQQAKKYRSQIFDLESRVRSLQIERIRLSQLLQDRSSQQQLRMIDEQGQQMCSLVEIGSMQKMSEKEVELKVKEDQLNFKIEEVIKHVLKLKTLKPNSSVIESNAEIESDASDNPEYKIITQ